MDFNFPEQLDNSMISTPLLTFIDYTIFINQYHNSKRNDNCKINFTLLPPIQINKIYFYDDEELKVM